MFNQFVSLTVAVNQPDGAVGHTVSCKMVFAATGIGCNLACYRNLLVRHIVQCLDEMHVSTVIKEYWGLPYFAGTDDMEVEATRGDHFVGGDIEQGDTILTDD